MAEPKQYIGIVPYALIDIGGVHLARHQIVSVEPKNAGTTYVVDVNGDSWTVNQPVADVLALITAGT